MRKRDWRDEHVAPADTSPAHREEDVPDVLQSGHTCTHAQHSLSSSSSANEERRVRQAIWIRRIVLPAAQQRKSHSGERCTMLEPSDGLVPIEGKRLAAAGQRRAEPLTIPVCFDPCCPMMARWRRALANELHKGGGGACMGIGMCNSLSRGERLLRER